MNCPHCNMHIDEHPIARCLDAWVAETVMGLSLEPVKHEWTEIESDLGWGVFCSRCYESLLYIKLEDAPPNGCVICHSRYSTSIASAWKVVEKFGGQITIQGPLSADFNEGCKYPDRWTVGFGPRVADWKANGEASIAPLAICRAAIKATA